MAWEAGDLEGAIAELRERGAIFEEYDVPGLKTVNGIVGADDIDIRLQGDIAWAEVARAVYPEGRRCTVHDRCGWPLRLSAKMASGR